MSELTDDDPETSPRRQFHTLSQVAKELGIGYKRARTLARNGYFGVLVRSGDAGLGPYLVPDAALQRLRNGEQVST